MSVKVSMEYLRESTTERLLKMEEDFRKQIFEVRQQQIFRKGLSVQKPHLYGEARKNIARIKTILNERKRNDN